jgi:hypothetical protein
MILKNLNRPKSKYLILKLLPLLMTSSLAYAELESSDEAKQQRYNNSLPSLSLSSEDKSIVKTCESTSSCSYAQNNLEEVTENEIYSKYNLIGVALFSGKDPISSLIKAITKSKIFHAGVILSDVNDENKWYCFESTGSATEAINGKYPHVRITPWDTIVKEYDGKISYRLLEFEEKQERVSPALVTRFVKKYNNMTYTRNFMRLIRALFKANKECPCETLPSAFCSELTAKMFMELDIPEADVASNYLPRDFSSKKDLSLASGIILTPEFKVVRKSK